MEGYLEKAKKSSSGTELYLDSAYNALAGNENDSVTRFYYRRTAAAYYNLRLYDKTLIAGKEIYRLGKEAKDTLTMARALYYSADSFYAKADNDSAFYYYTQAEKLYRKVKDIGTLGEIILYKAYIYYNIGEYALCESEAFEALAMLKDENKITHIYNCYNLIATALDGQNSNQEAIKYYNLALNHLALFKQEGYSDAAIEEYKASCYNNMGGVYVKMGNHRQAISFYRQALRNENLKSSSPSLYAKLLNNLAYARFKAGDYAGLSELFYQSLRIRDSLNNPYGIVASKIHLGEYLAFVKDTPRAVDYLKSAYAEANHIKSHYDILNSLELLAEIDTQNSVFYLNRYRIVNDSLQEVAKLNRNKFARIEYETDRLQDEKEELVKRNSFIIGVSAVLLLFIAAIFIIYYLNSRNKELLLIQEQQKASEEIYQLMFAQQSKVEAAKNEEKTRIAMELHDGILNNIYAVRLNLEFINKKSDEESIARRKEYIKELQKVEAEIRGVSHDLSRGDIFRQDQSFNSLLEFMIVSQKNNFSTKFKAEIDPAIDWDSLSNVVKANLYRIVQEALQNINKYSEAATAVVTVTKKGRELHVTVSDDGVGFDTGKARDGIGLKNLRKRAVTLNGKLSIISSPGKGTTIKVIFPEQHSA